MAIAQVTDNPALAHQDAKQQLHQYPCAKIQPLMQTGEALGLHDILHRIS